MTLRLKTLFSISITIICLLVVIYALSSTMFLKGFLNIERKHVLNSGERILSILNDDLSALSSAVGDWAAWDETYSFIIDADPLYVKKNLPDETYSELKINLIMFVDSSNKVVFKRGFDLQMKKELKIDDDILQKVTPFLGHESPDSSIQGIIMLDKGPMLIASRPIIMSDRKGPIRGSMIFGRYLNEEEIERWSEIAKLSIKINQFNGFDLKKIKFDVERDPFFIKIVDSETISCYVVIRDIYNKPVLLLSFDEPRVIYQQGKLVLNRFLMFLIGSGVLFGAVVLIFVERSVLARLTKLNRDLRYISTKSDHSLRIIEHGNDELSSIGNEINQMISSLQKSHSVLNSIIEDLPQGVILLNSEYRVIMTNKIGKYHLRKLFNATVGDVISNIGNYSLAEITPKLSHPSDQIKCSMNIDNSFYDITGKYFGSGDETGIILVTSDVTKDKVELMERLQSQENLSAVGQLAAGVAHDFNNVLTGIIGYAGLIYSDTTLPERVRNQLKIILNNADRAAELVRQILDFSRKSLSEFKVIDLSKFVQDFIKFIRRTLPESISIRFENKCPNCRIKADRTKIQQVLTNLSLNAKDAMPEGGNLIFSLSEISINNNSKKLIFENTMLPEGVWIVLSISDTGTGIPKNVLPRIFEPFYSTKEVGKGTGLGLSQVYGIVKQHYGYIDVDSIYGSGSTFTIYFPKTYEAVSIIDEQSDFMPKGNGETLLLIEDSLEVLGVISNTLTSLGYKVLPFQNAKDALDTFAADYKDISLVITDMVMPIMNGIELIKKMKDINSSVKAIILSGYPIGLKRDENLPNVITFLQKPLNIKELAFAIKDALNKGL